MTREKIAFLGLGTMGNPMAANLVKAGYQVSGFDLTGEYPEGVQSSSSCHEAAAGASIVILMLPDGKIVRNVLFGEDGVASFLKKGTIVIDMSSSHPAGTKELDAQLAKKGIHLIDAPVSGGVQKAEEGTLAIMVGGAQDTFSDVESLFEVMGEKIFHVGEIGSGHATKALNNLLSAVGLVASFEVFTAAQKSGIDPEKFLEVINASTGRNNTTEVKMKPHVLDRGFASGFGLSLMVKDIETAMDYAKDFGLDMVACQKAVEMAAKAEAKLPTGADHTEVAKLVEGAAGIRLGKT